MTSELSISVILLAGGIGSRMNHSSPKQYLLLADKPIALHSFERFLSLPEVREIIVVCHAEYHHLFEGFSTDKMIRFAPPGLLRQDSVYNGMVLIVEDSLVCIHDAARPLVSLTMIKKVVHEARHCGAAALGVRVKSTIKECDSERQILNTLDRSNLWEMQTPQVIQLSLLQEGFRIANLTNILVTDDISLVELLKHPSKVVEGSYTNIKITTPEDLFIAEKFIENNAHI